MIAWLQIKHQTRRFQDSCMWMRCNRHSYRICEVHSQIKRRRITFQSKLLNIIYCRVAKWQNRFSTFQPIALSRMAQPKIRYTCCFFAKHPFIIHEFCHVRSAETLLIFSAFYWTSCWARAPGSQGSCSPNRPNAITQVTDAFRF